MQSWNNRIALVTGASSGIGAAICKKLVDRGLTVIGCARNTDKIEALFPENEVKKDGGKLHAMKCDLTQVLEFLAMFTEIRKRYGRLDLVISNTGLNTDSPLLTGETKDWRKMFKVNFVALDICTHVAVRLMREKEVQEGQIIHISSLAAQKLPETTRTKFNIHCTNFMVRFHTDRLRQKINMGNTDKSHIRVASVYPGLVKTEFLSRMLGPETARTIYESTPHLKPEDVAEAVELILNVPPRVNVSDISIVPS